MPCARSRSMTPGEAEVFARAALAPQVRPTPEQARAHHRIANPDAAPVRRPPPRPVERVQPHAGEPDQGRIIAWPQRQRTPPADPPGAGH